MTRTTGDARERERANVQRPAASTTTGDARERERANVQRPATSRRTIVVGEGGSAIVAAATRPVVALGAEGLHAPVATPTGVPVHPAEALPDDLEVDLVELVPCEPATRRAVVRWAARHGIEVREASVEALPHPSGVRVVAVSSASTGSGKTPLVRRVVRALVGSGVRVAVARHPLASLLAWDRFDPAVVRSPRQLLGGGPVDEREELAPVVGLGVPVVTGLDPERVLDLAVREAAGGVVVWDGGGAARPWVTPDLHLVAVDLLREPPERASEHLAGADAVVLTKADTAPADRARAIEGWVRGSRPEVPVVLADLAVGVQSGSDLRDRRAVLVEDLSSLALGGLAAGAAAVAARRFRCGVVDPRPYARGAVAEVLTAHPHIGAVIPAVGRTPEEISDLADSVAATPAEVVLWASNADPAGILDVRRPVVRAFGELVEVAGPSLQEILAPVLY